MDYYDTLLYRQVKRGSEAKVGELKFTPDEIIYTVPLALNPNSIEKVIFNPPATIVIFKDGTKEVVKCAEGDEFVPEIGLAMALMNVAFGNRSKFVKFVEKYSKKL